MTRRRKSRASSRPPRGGGRQNQQGNNQRNDNSGVQDSTTSESTRASALAVAVSQMVASAFSQQPQPGQYHGFFHHLPHGYGPFGIPYGGNGFAPPLWGYTPPPPLPQMLVPYQAYGQLFQQMLESQYHAYGQLPPPPPPPPQPAVTVTNPYSQRDPRFAEWERRHASNVGQGQSRGSQPELSNAVEARRRRRRNRRNRQRLLNLRHDPVTMSNSASQVESNDVEQEDDANEEDDVKEEDDIKEEDDSSPTGAATGSQSLAKPDIKSEPKTP
ncbi:hypothetical protein PG997_013289 [Apiospora hydei]|uniref:BZIP domain-containing protein n=1 Tax=Apiospora hydei TaxID=1337664 RepID=A0ABR1V5Q2_9PEZI